ncbi:MAG: hypothetical protein IJR68_01630 [Fretibacterium sp.]|nr:hypothetical protein [Fretibacterium sp.]
MPVAEVQAELTNLLGTLSEESLHSAIDYVTWLRHLEEEEDRDDIACYLERRNEPEISLEELRQKLRQS